MLGSTYVTECEIYVFLSLGYLAEFILKITDKWYLGDYHGKMVMKGYRVTQDEDVLEI